MVRPGLINLDFADVRAVMDEMGKAMMGTGEATGEDRAIQAAEKAIANPLLDEISLRGANGVLINITGGHDLTLFELDEAANRIREEVDPDANIIVGSTLDTSIEGGMRVSVVATGIDANQTQSDIPVPRRSLKEPLKPAAEVEPAPVAEEAPAPAYEEPQVAAATPAIEEPSLFEEMDAHMAAAEEQVEVFEEPVAPAVQNDLPPPAYQPQVAQFQPRVDEYEEEPEASFVAPKAPAPGTPSPEALARLRTAVNKTPSAPQQRQQVVAEQPVAEEKPRFGINSLINRMTGQSQEAAAPQPARQQPNLQAAPAPVEDPEQERIEIPAFLRRQAN